jgi:hypothetical protein
MSKGNGRSTTPKRNSKGHFVKGSGSAKGGSSKSRTTKSRTNPTAAVARTNPARRKSSRRNPESLLSRAGAAYQQASGIVLGGVAAEQAKTFISKVMPDTTSEPSVMLSLASAAAPGLAGVLLMGQDAAFLRNVGLGMVATSTANTVGVLMDAFMGDAPAAPVASNGTAQVTADAAKRSGLLGPPPRRLAAPAATAGAGCGCPTTHTGVLVGAGNGL